jgi:hypothetical protein
MGTILSSLTITGNTLLHEGLPKIVAESDNHNITIILCITFMLIGITYTKKFSYVNQLWDNKDELN